MNFAPNPTPTIEFEAESPSFRERSRCVIDLGLAWLSGLIADHLATGCIVRHGGTLTNAEASRLVERTTSVATLRPSTIEARRAYEQARESMIAAGEPAAIDRISALFRLAPFDEDVLLLALAPQLREGFASAFSHMQGRPTIARATPFLACTLFSVAGAEADALVSERLCSEAPLRRYRLVESTDRTLTTLSPLHLDERMARLLCGETIEETRLQSMLFPVEPAPMPRRHRDGVDGLAERLRTAARAVAVIVGPKRSGRRATARAVAERFGLGLALFKPRPFEPVEDLLALVAREALLGGVAILVDAAQPEAVALLHHRIDAIVIAIAETRLDLPLPAPHLRLEPLEPEDHAALWRDALGIRASELDGRLEAVADQFRLGPGEIAEIVAEGGDLWQACRERAGRALEELADRIVPHYGWDDMVLPPEVLHDLKAVTAQMRHRAIVYNRQGFARKLARGRGVSVLLSGPSGTGKTMAAEVIANDLDLDLYRIDLSGVISKYIGETEKNLKAVFDAAEASGAVLFFDEADALFGKRSDVKDSHDRYANIEVSYLLQRMENYGGLAILATNMKGHLDSAFLRRLRFAIDIPFPDTALRRLLWMKAFPEELPKEALDFDVLARLDIAGGNISVIAVNAAFLAAAEASPLSMRHVTRAARAEFRKLDKEFRVPWTQAV